MQTFSSLGKDWIKSKVTLAVPPLFTPAKIPHFWQVFGSFCLLKWDFIIFLFRIRRLEITKVASLKYQKV